MKPDWKDAPEWANYLAMDSDGEWFWYESPPGIGLKCWRVSEGACSNAGTDWTVTKGLSCYAGTWHWTETKEERPALSPSSTKEN